MGVGILAPVPATILRSAEDTCAAVGRVAFGSEAWEVFNRADLEYGTGLAVLIYPTQHYGDPNQLCDPGYACFRAVYLGTKPSRAGRHPDPSARPPATIHGPDADTAWPLFWEVSNLVPLSKRDRVAIVSLTAERQKKPLGNGFVPHGPMLVKAAVL
jgi:hypothetical protein